MRIAYIALHIGHQLVKGGVGNKISSQLRIWQRKGHDARIFLLTPDLIDIENYESYQFKPRFRFPILATLSREVSRSNALARLIDGVARYKPDIIYLRFGMYAFPLMRLFKIAPVVLEINTNDIMEYRSRGMVYSFANRLTRGSMLKGSTGLVFVSNEIAEFSFNKIYSKPGLVIANGIDLDRFNSFPAPMNDHPRLAFVGSPNLPWHGSDKVVSFAQQCDDLQIDLIGYPPESLPAPLPANLMVHGFLPAIEVARIIAHADVAFGSLALHRINLQEASPLKVREALAYGIPVVLAYIDTDFSNANFEFILRLPNTEDNLVTHRQQVHDFAYAMRGRRVDRALIYDRIDQSRKEDARLAFFSMLVGS